MSGVTANQSPFSYARFNAKYTVQKGQGACRREISDSHMVETTLPEINSTVRSLVGTAVMFLSKLLSVIIEPINVYAAGSNRYIDKSAGYSSIPHYIALYSFFKVKLTPHQYLGNKHINFQM